MLYTKWVEAAGLALYRMPCEHLSRPRAHPFSPLFIQIIREHVKGLLEVAAEDRGGELFLGEGNDVKEFRVVEILGSSESAVLGAVYVYIAV